MTTVSMTWAPVKRPSGACYDVQSEGGIRCTAWPIAKLCHAKLLSALMQGTPDDAGDCSPSHRLTILRVLAVTRAFYRFEASDRSRNFPDAVRAWNAYVERTIVVENQGRLEAIDKGCRMGGWTELPGILPMIAQGGDR